MTETDPSPAEPTLYACQDCGTGVEDPANTTECPACGGPLVNTTLPHD